MTIKRMDNVLIVVDDLEAAKAFFSAWYDVGGPDAGRGEMGGQCAWA